MLTTIWYVKHIQLCPKYWLWHTFWWWCYLLIIPGLKITLEDSPGIRSLQCARFDCQDLSKGNMIPCSRSIWKMGRLTSPLDNLLERDRSMNFSPPSTAVCANCRWRWPEAIHSRREHESTGFLIWHKTRNRSLCYLCAQSCPDLHEKNPKNFVFSTYKECHDKREECMVPPSDQSVVTWDKHIREVWQKPWVSDETLSVAKSSDSKDLLSGICQLQSSVILLQEELSGLAHKLENLKEVVMHSAEGQYSSWGFWPFLWENHLMWYFIWCMPILVRQLIFTKSHMQIRAIWSFRIKGNKHAAKSLFCIGCCQVTTIIFSMRIVFFPFV